MTMSKTGLRESCFLLLLVVSGLGLWFYFHSQVPAVNNAEAATGQFPALDREQPATETALFALG